MSSWKGDLFWLATPTEHEDMALSDKNRRGEQAHERSPPRIRVIKNDG
jgi:hypothetical protein